MGHVRRFVDISDVTRTGKNGYAAADYDSIVRPSGRGTVHSRPHKLFLHFHDLSTLLNKIREGVALSPLSILHKTH